MSKTLFSTLLGAAALLSVPSVGLSQHGGHGGHGGGSYGGHGGGGYYGGHGGYYGGGYGGYYGGGYGYYGGGYGGYYGRGYGYGYGAGFGLYVGFPRYAYGSPYYGSSYYYEPSYSYAQPVVGTTSYYSPADAAPTAAPAQNTDVNAVNLEVRVPENATLWISGEQTRPTGAVRHFVSAPLQPGRTFTYDIRARWTNADGRPVERTKKVDVQAGAWIGVDFNKP